MDVLERLLLDIRSFAADYAMEAYVVGTKSSLPIRPVYPGSEGEAVFADGRLFKLCPAGVPTRPLLEIELHENQLRLYKHRDASLTETHRGRFVTQEWVHRFIEANTALAREISDARAASLPPAEPTSRPNGLSQEEWIERRAERTTHRCPCQGEVEDCPKCSGSGTYLADGFGNLV